MATAYANDYEDFVTCGICLCLYNDAKRKPKFLPCTARHTVCLLCLTKMCPTHAKVACPFCRETFNKADIFSLPNNIYILHLLKLKETTRVPVTGAIFNPLGLSACPTCGSGINDARVNQLISAIEKHQEAQKQLDAMMKSINATGEEVKKLQEENNLKLTQKVSVVEMLTREKPKQSQIKAPPTTTPRAIVVPRRSRPTSSQFVLNDASIFVLRLFQSGIPKGEIHISPEMSCLSNSHEFLQKLGEFCYKSQKNFSSTVEMGQAMSQVFVLFSMENPQFQPTSPNNFDYPSDYYKACDYGEVGITLMKSSNFKVISWSFVLLLEENDTFENRENLPESVTNNEFIGHVVYNRMMFAVIDLSKVSKSERTCYTFTLESR